MHPALRIHHICGHTTEYIGVPPEHTDVLRREYEQYECNACHTYRVCVVCGEQFDRTDGMGHVFALELQAEFKSGLGSYPSYGQRHDVCSKCGRETVDSMTHLFNLYTAMPSEVRLLTQKFLIERMRYGDPEFRHRMLRWGAGHEPLPVPEPLVSGTMGTRRYT